ncbi:MAG: hypothetical protein AB3N28_04275 [Kordiimonas sp.]
MRPNWAVICGAIRSKFEFEITLNAALELKYQGLIAEIVVSTWHDSFRDDLELRQRIQGLGVYIVSVPQIKAGGNGQTYRQHRLLEAALEVCPADVAVLKMRTDKCVHRIRYFKESLKKGLKPNSAENEIYKILKCKIAVISGSLTMPFNISDVMYYALKEDIRELLHLDMWYDWVCYPGTINAEIRWFSRPFVKRLKLLKAYFEYFNCRKISEYFIDSVRENDGEGIHDFFFDVLAANLLCLRHNFDLVSDYGLATDINVRKLFQGENERYGRLIPITMSKHIVAFNNLLVANLTDNKCETETIKLRLDKALERQTDESYAYRDILPSHLRDVHQQCFPDTPTDCFEPHYVRYATNIYKPDVAKVHTFLAEAQLPITPVIEEERAYLLDFVNSQSEAHALEVMYYLIAEKYRTGDGVHRSAEEYKRWIELSAQSRYRPAEKDFADILANDGEYDAAAPWYHKAAVRGDEEAQLAISKLLQNNLLSSVEADWRRWEALASK